MDESDQAIWESFFDQFDPPEELTRSEWAENYRRLSPEASSKAGGLFSFDMFPWQREPLNMIDNPEYGRMCLQWASQLTGKTETVNNIVGSQVYMDPCAILMIQPTVDLAQTWSKDRCDTMFRDTPCLRDRIKPAKSRDSGNTILHKQFPGGRLTIIGANAPRQLASRPIKIVLADEVDGFPASAGKEGDPIKLAEKRTESFSDAFMILVSTPLIKGESRIEREFLASDQRFWNVPCIRCGRHQVFSWGQVRWDDDDPHSARMECQHCQAELDDKARRTMAAGGEWVPTYPERKILGYQLNGINALLPAKRPWKTRMEQMVAEHIESQRSEEERKTWLNTFMAETYEPPADKHDPHELIQRRENYPAEVPSGALILIKSVDVQKDRLEVFTAGYGLGDECWAIDYHVIAGDPSKRAVWKELTDDIATEYTHENGHILTASLTAVDEGYKRDMVRNWVKKHRGSAIAVKGDAKAGALLFRTQKKFVQGLRPYHIGTDTAKDQLFAELTIDEHGPGYHHFPLDDQKFGSEYFEQLTAEQCRTVYDKQGFPKRVWSLPKGARNEALDLAVYAKGAWKIYLARKRPNLDQLAAMLAEPADHSEPAAPAKKVKEYKLNPPEKPKGKSKPKRARIPGKGFVNSWKK